MNVRPNLGSVDRTVRALLGLTAVYAGAVEGHIFGDPLLAWLVAGFGALNVVSAAMRWCVIYRLAGISTWKTSPAQ